MLYLRSSPRQAGENIAPASHEKRQSRRNCLFCPPAARQNGSSIAATSSLVPTPRISAVVRLDFLLVSLILHS